MCRFSDFVVCGLVDHLVDRLRGDRRALPQGDAGRTVRTPKKKRAIETD